MLRINEPYLNKGFFCSLIIGTSIVFKFKNQYFFILFTLTAELYIIF